MTLPIGFATAYALKPSQQVSAQRGDRACGCVEKKRLTISTLSFKLLQMFTELFNAIAFANASTAGQFTSNQLMNYSRKRTL